MKAFADTNILLYSISAHPEELEKRDVARTLLTRDISTLSVQVLNEFVWRAAHPRRGSPLSPTSIERLTTEWSSKEVLTLDLAIFQLAWTVSRRTNYQWWDCLIVAAAIQSGCGVLYSEDMQHGHVIDGVRIENPFRDLG